MSREQLAKSLNDIVKELQACKMSLVLAADLVPYESNANAQILLWYSDLEFVEALIGMWMSDNGLSREYRVFTRHIKQQSHTGKGKIARELLEEPWIGVKGA